MLNQPNLKPINFSVKPITDRLTERINSFKNDQNAMFDQLIKKDIDNARIVKLPESEISLLRKEVADLKALMTPSIILTGQRAIDEYWALTKIK